jgi:hypothetical protein
MSQFRLFHISELMDRLNKVAEIDRYDQVARNVQALYAKKQEENPDSFFASAHIQNTYSNFAGMNKESRFKEHFSDVFAKPAEKTSLTGRDTTFIQEHEVSAAQSSNSEFIRMSSLQKVKKVADSSLSIPQYRYKGYVRVANMGDSGFANWSVSFNTTKGMAELNVPVTIVDGYAYDADRFFTPEGVAVAFNKEELNHYSKTFGGAERKIAYQKSGLVALGNQSVIPESQINYEEDVVENNSINLSYSIPISEEFTAQMDSVEQSLQTAISKARQEIENRLSSGEKGQSLSLTVNMNYSGAIPYSEEQCEVGHPMEDVSADGSNVVIVPMGADNALEADPTPEELESQMYEVKVPENQFNGVIAFNISNKTRNGMRVATIPVEVINGKAKATNFFGKSGIAMALDTTTLEAYLNDSIEVSTADEEVEQEAFSDAFLASDMSLNQLRKEMKQSIEGKNLPRANACLSTISGKFSTAATQNATKEYFQWINDVKNNKKTTISWVAEGDSMYDGDIKSSSIIFSQSYE